ncbi:MAG: hypothetical protein QM773_08625 [Hyphomonadaceae bacterium]
MIRGIVLAAVLAITAGPAFAQQPPEPEDRVTVEGRRAEDAVRAFVSEVAAAPKGANLARWDRKVCVGVMNLKTEYAQKLADEVSLAAVKIGLEPGEPGCRANVLILADSEADALASRLVKDSLKQLEPPDNRDGSLGRSALRKFEISDAPVRWWHVSQTVLTDTGKAFKDGKQVTVRGMGRLKKNVRENMVHVLIILDTKKIGVVSFPSLADYVSVVALAQIGAEADMHEFPSILNLFSSKAGDRASRMTQWDLDYLKSLYAVDGNAVSATLEARRIEQQMLDLQTKREGEQ